MRLKSLQDIKPTPMLCTLLAAPFAASMLVPSVGALA